MNEMSGKLPRLVLSELIDLPVVEASGVAVRRTERGAVVLVVGDRTSDVGVCVIGADGSLDDWETIDLAVLPDWPLPPGDSQFEAIAADGGSVVAVMTEDPPLVLVADTVTRGQDPKLPAIIYADIGDNAGGVDGVAVYGDLRETRTDVQTLNGHDAGYPVSCRVQFKAG